MMGKTHLVIGVAIGLSTAYVLESDVPHAFALTAFSAAGALLPDVDHPRSMIRDFLWIPGDILFSQMPHRGITHTFLAMVVVVGIIYFLLPASLNVIGFAVLLGFFSHLIADVVTPRGLPLLLPFTDRQFHLLPEPLRIKVNSLSEKIIYYLTILISVGVLLSLLVRWTVSLF
jgi:inner membrane protein